MVDDEIQYRTNSKTTMPIILVQTTLFHKHSLLLETVEITHELLLGIIYYVVKYKKMQ